MPDSPSNAIVIGASAGGLTALMELARQLPVQLDAAYFMVLHLSKKTIGEFLVRQLKKNTALNCKLATDGEAIKKNTIYVARSNEHLIVKKNLVGTGFGPEENRWRPSIDVLFRSAAVAYGSRTTGIILTGLLNDGTTGMEAIKKCGGTCIVQDPKEAEYPDMPLSVLQHLEVDYCIRLADMGNVITAAVNSEKITSGEIPPELKKEAEIAESAATGFSEVSQLGNQSAFACPDCGGALWEIKNSDITRYRCHIGHAYTAQELSLQQSQAAETTLWIALRIMEERKSLLQKFEKGALKKGLERLASVHRQKVEELGIHIKKLREIIFSLEKNESD